MTDRSSTLTCLCVLFLALVCPAVQSASAGDDSDSVNATAVQRSAREELTAKEEALLRRPDERRPTRQLAVDVFGRPLVFGVIYELRTRGNANLSFKDRRTDDLAVFTQRLSPEVFYRLPAGISLFLKGNAVHRSRWKFFETPGLAGLACWDANADNTCNLAEEDANHDGKCTPADCSESADEHEGEFVRGETWLYASRILDTPISVQVGRQRVFEAREWWWDEDLDMFRLHFDRAKLHFETGVAQLLGRISTLEDQVDPEEDGILRLMARLSWAWTRKNRLEAFALRQWDRSSTQEVDEDVEAQAEDPSDADLTWLGVAARGRTKLRRRRGKLYYWLDTAVLHGRETSLDFGGKPENRFVDAVSRHSVRGWGVDGGATWQTRLPGRLAFTLGYAMGSGDDRGKNQLKRAFNKSDLQRINDRSFRQTGIQRNNARFRGVNRIRYYGELLDPELSNLRVLTASVGFRFLRRSSVELLYHAYRQVEAAKFLRDATVRRQPAGRKRAIGQEIDLAVGIEEWEHLDVELIGAAFQAGSAFGNHCDDDGKNVPSSPAVPADCPDAEDFVPASRGDWSYMGFVKIKVKY